MITLIIGRRELGKTTLARYMGYQQSPRIIIDPRAQWPASDPYRIVEGENMVADLESGSDVLIQPTDLQPAVDRLSAVAQHYAIDTDERKDRRLTILFDEAGLYDLREWDYMMRCSPRDRVAIILTAHRPADISTNIRALADTWCIFRTTQAHDLIAIEDRCGERVALLVQKLEPYQFVGWDDAKATATIYRNSRAWFTPFDAPVPPSASLDGEPDAAPDTPQRKFW